MRFIEVADPSEEPAMKEVSRSAVLHEVWIGAEDPKVYLLLVHKISKDWWELPGGLIEGYPTTDTHFMDEAVREWKEEVHIAEKPRDAFYPISLVGDDPLGSDTDIVLVDRERKIISHPFMMRQVYDSLPEVTSGHTNEHDAFLWLDVTQLYSAENNQAARSKMRALFGNLEAVGDKGHLQSVKASLDTNNSTIVRLEPPTFHWEMGKDLAFSVITAKVIDHYLNPFNAYPPPPRLRHPK